MTAVIWRGILIPFLGTALGAACVFFMRRELSDSLRRAMTGFAAGVMTAASVWSLLIPSLEQSAGMGVWSFVPPAVGLWVGILFLLLLDRVIPHLHHKSEQAEGPKNRLRRTTMLTLAVLLHNIPEGMVIGVLYAGLASDSAQLTAAGAENHHHAPEDDQADVLLDDDVFEDVAQYVRQRQLHKRAEHLD